MWWVIERATSGSWKQQLMGYGNGDWRVIDQHVNETMTGRSMKWRSTGLRLMVLQVDDRRVSDLQVSDQLVYESVINRLVMGWQSALL